MDEPVDAAAARADGARAPMPWWVGLAVTPLLRWLVLVHAVPSGQPWRTTCPACPALLPGRFGVGASDSAALLPRARCGRCGQRVGPTPYLIEVTLLITVAAVAIAATGGWWSAPALVALLGWAVLSVPLAAIDVAVHRLPDRFTLPAAGWVLAWLAVAALTTGEPGDWVRAAIAGLACGAGFAIITFVFGARGFGLGDAKLALSAVALLGWLGWTAVVAGLLLAFLSSGLVATVLLATRRVGRQDALPFGPFLIGGTLAALVWAGLSV
jgi:leader peptidase (prepilin peptidase)/N-methyltransferase